MYAPPMMYAQPDPVGAYAPYVFARGGDEGDGGPVMRDILNWGNYHKPNEWSTEHASQFTYAPSMVPVPMAPPMAAPVMMPAALSTAAPPPPEQPAVPAPAPAVETAEAPAAEAAAPPRPRTASAKSQRPPFHLYGRGNTRPTVGGFVFGDYMATHNARAGTSLPLRQRPGSSERTQANTHMMEADMRASARQRADSEMAYRVSSELAEEAAAPAEAEAVAPTPAEPAAPSAASSAPVSAPATEPPVGGADPYALLPAYNPGNYCGAAASWPAAAQPAVGYPMPAGHSAMPYAGLMPFEPDPLGSRLNPRRFKFAPHAVLRSLPPAGRRSLRADNL